MTGSVTCTSSSVRGNAVLTVRGQIGTVTPELISGALAALRRKRVHSLLLDLSGARFSANPIPPIDLVEGLASEATTLPKSDGLYVAAVLPTKVLTAVSDFALRYRVSLFGSRRAAWNARRGDAWKFRSSTGSSGVRGE